eukprot:509603_1
MVCGKTLTCLDIFRLVLVDLSALVSSSVVGYQALLPMLQDEHIFHSLCDKNDNEPCRAQNLRLDLMYNVAIGGLHFVCIIWGTLCLKYGGRPVVLISGFLVCAGSIIFSFGWDWPCFVSYIIMGCGCSGMVFGVISIPAEYPVAMQGLLFSILIGCVDAGSGINYIFLLLYKNTNITMKELFLSLGIAVGVLTFFLTVFVFSTSFKNEIKKAEDDKLLSDDHTVQKQSIEPIEINENDAGVQSTTDVESKKKVWTDWNEVFTSIEFFLLLVFCCLYITTKYFYITTLNDQIKWITDNDKHKIYVSQQVFSVMLLCSGFLAVLNGTIIDKGGMKLALCVQAVASMVMATCSIIKVFNLQWFTMICCVFNRFLYFAMAPLLLATVFGVERQQFVYGVICFVAAFFNLTGYLLDDITTSSFNGNFTFANMLLAGLCAVTALSLAMVLRRHPNVT